MSAPPLSTNPLDLAARINSWMAAHTDAMLSTLEALVHVESPTSDRDAQERLFALLTTLLDDLDYRTLRVPSRKSGGLIVARPLERTRRPAQLLLGHGDTVWPHGTHRTMPFQIRDGRAWGPGTYDTKAGLVQAIFALRALRELELDPPLTPVFLVNSDEETGSADSSRHVARLARAVERAWVLEPSLGPEGHLKSARKGVGHFTVAIQGRAAHAGLDPEKGISATVALAEVIGALHALNDHPRGNTVNIGEIRGGTRRNVIPARAAAEVDVRAWTRDDAQGLERAIRAIQPTLPGAEISVQGGFVKQPMERGPGSDALWQAASQAAAQLGIPLDHAAAGGASDGNTTALHCPTLDGLGAVGDGAHATHEHVLIASMPERAALLTLLLLSPRQPR